MNNLDAYEIGRGVAIKALTAMDDYTERTGHSSSAREWWFVVSFDDMVKVRCSTWITDRSSPWRQTPEGWTLYGQRVTLLGGEALDIARGNPDVTVLS